MDENIERKITDIIGENLDKLITIDWRGQGMIHPLYNALREKSDGPLAMRAAQKFINIINEEDVVFIMTGFPVGPFDILRNGKYTKEHIFRNDMLVPETDGIVSSALIARAVDLGFKARPVIFCEEECIRPVKASCIAAGLRVFNDFETSLLMPHTVTVLPFTKNEAKAHKETKKLLDIMNPKAAISIERPGKNEKGVYHMANGRSITEFVAKIDELFISVANRGGLTIGIGDLGNELGLGALKEATQKFVFYGSKCRCGCGGGIGAVYSADATIFGAISDDAAYAFLASLAYLLSNLEILQQAEMEIRVLEACSSNGATDGPSGLCVPWIDYLDVKNHICQIELMRDIIKAPMKYYNLQPFFYSEI